MSSLSLLSRDDAINAVVEYLPAAEREHLSRRDRDLWTRYGLIWAACHTKRYSREDEHDGAFDIATSFYYRFNPEWTQEMVDLSRLYDFVEFNKKPISALSPWEKSLLDKQLNHIMKKFNINDVELVGINLALHRREIPDEVLALRLSFPPAVREHTVTTSHYTITIRKDPTIETGRRRFEVLPVAATLFVYYSSLEGGGALGYEEALDRFSQWFPPPHVERRQFFRNLRRFSCLLDPPWCRLNLPQLSPATDTPPPSLS